MKNTKHTEMNDSSIEQDNQENLSQSKRKILTSIGVTSGVVGASALVPSTWVKPAVNSVILPAHAQATDMMTTPGMDGDMMTTPGMDGDMMTTPGMDGDMMTTTPEPEMMAGIVLSTMAITLTEGGDSKAADLMATYMVSLATMPAASVEVVMVQSGASDTQSEVTLAPESPLTFTMGNWSKPQEVTVSITDEDNNNDGSNVGGGVIRIFHDARAYTPTSAIVTVTVEDKDTYTPDLGAVTVKHGSSDLSVAEAIVVRKANVSATELLVAWIHSENADVASYEVTINNTGAMTSHDPDVRLALLTGLTAGTEYHIVVTAIFNDGSRNTATVSGTPEAPPSA